MTGKHYGWRARIGLLTPDINTVSEVEFNRHAPEGVTVHAARLPLDDPVDAAALEGMNRDVDRATDAVAKVDPDVVAYGVTAGSFYRGKGYDVELAERIEERAGVPAVTTATAARRAFEALDLESLVIATPYIDELSDLLVAYLEQHGYSVLDVHGEDFASGADYGTSTPRSVYRRVRSIDTDEADGVFISGMEYHGMPVVETLEADLDKPVVSAHQATLWDALRAAGVGSESVQAGSLFDL
ncbi:maleate cis-trans isomerase family protein [Halorarum halobium]|uniref:maleate cis-trans isomerase family protein n=1 Tax=Halorarum halobium TaxID=3075121 RepID=UPI0028ABF1AA|nr:maleate cis-trans isomerase [Halobaculum sp. XH14]